MQNEHFNCDCVDCRTIHTNHKELSDHTEKSFADLIGGKLRSNTHYVNIYSNPTGVKLKEIKKGKIIGTIYSWVKDKAGNVWYQLEGENKGFVKHRPEVFDLPYIELTVAEVRAKEQAEIDAAVAKRLANNPITNIGKSLTNIDLFGSLKLVLFLAVAAVVVGLFIRFSGK